MKSNRGAKVFPLNKLMLTGLVYSVTIPALAFAILCVLIVQLEDRLTLVLVCVFCAIITLLDILMVNYVVMRKVKERILEQVGVGIEYTRGNRNVRATVTGEDELAMLSMTLNKIFAMHGDMAEKTRHLDKCRQVRVYRHAAYVVLQIQREVPPDDDPLNPSFRVAVALSHDEAVALASELMGK